MAPMNKLRTKSPQYLS